MSMRVLPPLIIEEEPYPRVRREPVGRRGANMRCRPPPPERLEGPRARPPISGVMPDRGTVAGRRARRHHSGARCAGPCCAHRPGARCDLVGAQLSAGDRAAARRGAGPDRLARLAAQGPAGPDDAPGADRERHRSTCWSATISAASCAAMSGTTPSGSPTRARTRRCSRCSARAIWRSPSTSR